MGSRLPFVHNRSSHVAVTWKDLVIIWGGTADEHRWPSEFDPNAVYCHMDGKWIAKTTCGDVPGIRENAGAEVLDDTMYLMFGEYEGWRICDGIYALDLNSWRWTKLNPKGTPPFKCSSLSTWIHNGKFYGFGGKISKDDMPSDWDSYPDYLVVTEITEPSGMDPFTNQLFCYNVAANCWEWPSACGDMPPPRYNHTTIVCANNNDAFICGDAAILFGGQGIIRERLGHMNDLYILRLDDMVWIRAHRSMISRGIPRKRAEHSLTLVSSKSAVLFGGEKQRSSSPLIPSDDDFGHGDCWILNTERLLNYDFDLFHPSYLWKRCWYQENRPSSLDATRLCHRAAVEPVSKRLWILGGAIGWMMHEPYPTEIISMSFNSAAPLRLLAMESALSHFDPTHPVWEAHKIPQHLRTELEDRRSHVEEERRTGMKGQRYNKY